MKVSNKSILLEIKAEAEDRLKFRRDSRELFLALLILKCSVSVSTKVPTAGARLDWDGRPLIIVNPDFWSKIDSSAVRFAILTHEVFHIMLEHFSRFDLPTGGLNSHLQNIAMDCAANQMILEFMSSDSKIGDIQPVNYHTFKDFLKEPVEYDERETAEYYFNLLKDNSKLEEQIIEIVIDNPFGNGEGEGGGQGEGEGDEEKDGEGGGQGEGQGGGKIKIKVKKIYVGGHKNQRDEQKKSEESLDKQRMAQELFKDLVRRTMSRSGASPADFGIDITKRNDINWKQLVKMFLAQSSSSDLRRLRTRKNKRYGWVSPKRSHKKRIEVDVMVDTSGSMSWVLQDLFGELVTLSEQQADFQVYCVDTEITDVGKVRTRKDLENLKIPTGGGTDFNAAFPYLEKRKDKRPVLFLTDAYGGFPEQRPSYECLILSVESELYDGMAPWARKITLDISKSFSQES